MSRLLISRLLPRLLQRSIESRKHRGIGRIGRRTIGLDFNLVFFRSRSKKGRERKKKRSAIRNRVERLLFQRCYIRYITPVVHISTRSGIDDRPLYRRNTRGTVVTRKRIRVYASPNTDVRIFLDCISRNTSYTHAIRPIFAARESMLISYMRFVDGKLKGVIGSLLAHPRRYRLYRSIITVLADIGFPTGDADA